MFHDHNLHSIVSLVFAFIAPYLIRHQVLGPNHMWLTQLQYTLQNTHVVTHTCIHQSLKSHYVYIQWHTLGTSLRHLRGFSDFSPFWRHGLVASSPLFYLLEALDNLLTYSEQRMWRNLSIMMWRLKEDKGWRLEGLNLNNTLFGRNEYINVFRYNL